MKKTWRQTQDSLSFRVMSNLLDFIANRRSELRKEKKDFLKRYKAEMEQLKAAEQAARGASPQDIAESTHKSPKSGVSDKPTIQDYILAVLRRFPDGIDANRINNEIEAEFGKIYMRSSLSPQLSRLKNKGKVELSGKVWRLKNGTPAEAGAQSKGAGQSGAGLLIQGPAGANPAASTQNSPEVAASGDETEEVKNDRL